MVLIENNNAGVADTIAMSVHNFKLVIIIFLWTSYFHPQYYFSVPEGPQIKMQLSCLSYFPDAQFYAERQVLSPYQC